MKNARPHSVRDRLRRKIEVSRNSEIGKDKQFIQLPPSKTKAPGINPYTVNTFDLFEGPIPGIFTGPIPSAVDNSSYANPADKPNRQHALDAQNEDKIVFEYKTYSKGLVQVTGNILDNFWSQKYGEVCPYVHTEQHFSSSLATLHFTDATSPNYNYTPPKPLKTAPIEQELHDRLCGKTTRCSPKVDSKPQTNRHRKENDKQDKAKHVIDREEEAVIHIRAALLKIAGDEPATEEDANTAVDPHLISVNVKRYPYRSHSAATKATAVWDSFAPPRHPESSAGSLTFGISMASSILVDDPSRLIQFDKEVERNHTHHYVNSIHHEGNVHDFHSKIIKNHVVGVNRSSTSDLSQRQKGSSRIGVEDGNNGLSSKKLLQPRQPLKHLNEPRLSASYHRAVKWEEAKLASAEARLKQPEASNRQDEDTIVLAFKEKDTQNCIDKQKGLVASLRTQDSGKPEQLSKKPFKTVNKKEMEQPTNSTKRVPLTHEEIIKQNRVISRFAFTPKKKYRGNTTSESLTNAIDGQELVDVENIAKQWPDVERALHISRLLTKEEINKLFQSIDTNQNGFIGEVQLRLALKGRGMTLTDKQVHSLVIFADKNSDGRIDSNEFSLLWQNIAKLHHQLLVNGEVVADVIKKSFLEADFSEAPFTKERLLNGSSVVTRNDTTTQRENFLSNLISMKASLKKTVLPSTGPSKPIIDIERLEVWKSFKASFSCCELNQYLSLDMFNDAITPNISFGVMRSSEKTNQAVQKYITMLKAGLPLSRVQEKMEVEGLDPFLLPNIAHDDVGGNLQPEDAKTSTLVIEEQLGRGKFAAVYSASHKERENICNKVALKVAQFALPTCVHRGLYKDNGIVMPPAGVVKEFARELRLLLSLPSSSCIPKLRFVLLQPFAIALELQEGGDLATSLEDDSWQFNTSLQIRIGILRDVALGLKHLHDAGFVHRDIKPHNIVLRYDVSCKGLSSSSSPPVTHDDLTSPGWTATAKLCDFGTSLKIAKKTKMDTELFAWLDGISEAVGTSGYTAPEVLMHDDEYVFASDIFSYGIVCWEVTSQSRFNPLKGKDAKVTVGFLNAGVRPPIDKDQPIFLAKIIQSAWCTDPLRRPTSDVIVQLYNELLSSPGCFMQLFNRKFFAIDEASSRRRRQESLDVNPYHLRKAEDRQEVIDRDGNDQTLFLDAVLDARTTEVEVNGLETNLRKWEPYGDKYEILEEVDRVISAVRFNRPQGNSTSTLNPTSADVHTFSNSPIAEPKALDESPYKEIVADESSDSIMLISDKKALCKFLSSLTTSEIVHHHKGSAHIELNDGYSSDVTDKASDETITRLVIVNLISATDLINSDVRPRITLGKHEEVGATINNTLNPVWNKQFVLPWDGISVLKLDIQAANIYLSEDDGDDQSLGFIEISLVLFEIGKTNKFDIPLKDAIKGSIQFEVTVKVLDF